MRRESILRIVTRLLLPYILLFALYVQFHGDFGPGGGFQAGIIFGSGIILYGLIFGLHAARRVARPSVLERLLAFGLLLYGGVGVVTMLAGGNFLSYGALNPQHPGHGQHWGILLIELGVGIAVAAAMVLIFFSFAGRRKQA